MLIFECCFFALSKFAMFLFGLEVDLISSVLLFFAFILVFVGGLVNFCEPWLPDVLNNAFRYGKVARGRSDALLSLLEMPKANFTHFYVFALIYVSLVLVSTLFVYSLDLRVWPFVLEILDFISTTNRGANSSAEATILALFLLWIQSGRRLYECVFVNVVTKSARMNIFHYIVGYVHYFAAATGIIVEAPRFAPSSSSSLSFSMRNLTWWQLSMSLLFLWAWYHQFKSHLILAETKKRNKGKYGLPKGDWFDFVNCPHYLAEVLMYFCLSTILGFEHRTGLIVFLWVLINQSVSALMSHYWYLEKFEEARNRKAIFPFLL